MSKKQNLEELQADVGIVTVQDEAKKKFYEAAERVIALKNELITQEIIINSIVIEYWKIFCALPTFDRLYKEAYDNAEQTPEGIKVIKSTDELSEAWKTYDSEVEVRRKNLDKAGDAFVVANTELSIKQDRVNIEVENFLKAQEVVIRDLEFIGSSEFDTILERLVALPGVTSSIDSTLNDADIQSIKDHITSMRPLIKSAINLFDPKEQEEQEEQEEQGWFLVKPEDDCSLTGSIGLCFETLEEI